MSLSEKILKHFGHGLLICDLGQIAEDHNKVNQLVLLTLSKWSLSMV